MSHSKKIESFTIDRPGPIQILGGGYDSALLWDGEPFAINWNDSSGTILQYLVRSGSLDFAGKLSAYRKVVESDLDLKSEIAPQLEPLISLLDRGVYGLKIESGPMEVIDVHEFSAKEGSQDGYYPDGNLNATRRADSYDPARIAWYREQIQGGGTPVAVTLQAYGAYGEYILDGHHKLAAWELENQDSSATVTFVRIVRISEYPVTELDAAPLLRGHPDLWKHWTDFRQTEWDNSDLDREPYFSSLPFWKLAKSVRNKK